jgi:hypothetical protein
VKIILSRALLGISAVLVLFAVSVAPVRAADNKPADSSKTAASSDKNAAGTATGQAQNAVQTYSADSNLQAGLIVKLSGQGTAKVTPASISKPTEMFGVTITGNGLPVTITSGNSNEVFVATGGTYDTLVSTQNGSINKGDYVTISSVDGIAMLAQPEQKTVFGRAAGSFDGKSNVVANSTLKDKSGKEIKKVAIGLIPVVIDIRTNPLEKSTKANMPKVLQRIGEAVAEKPVGPLRIYLSIGITGISIIAAIVILYSGVRSSLIAIGRNPLSKKSVFRGLLEIIFTALIILIIGLFAVYLLLKL